MNISPSYLLHTLAIPQPPSTAEQSRSTPSTPSFARHTRSIDASATGPTHESDAAKNVIYGSTTATPPNANLTQKDRLQLTDAYAGRIVQQLANIESGSEGESNLKFQQSRQFLQPAGYFSGGVLAAGFDPQEKITVTLNTYVGVGSPTTLTNSDKRSYFAWEIAAGALAHDKAPRDGPINFHSMHIEQQDKRRIEDLESVGSTLQDHWENEVSEPLRDVSGALAKRSGKADAYVVRGTLQSLRDDKASFEKLTPGSREAIDRTLDKLGNVVIPNIFGYPMAGYAFVPEVNYHGDYDHRPNKGLMIDLKNGTVNEIHDDKDFANWAKNNRSAIVRSFNASDRQSSKNTHWPKAADVLDNLIIGNLATYRGRSGALSDKDVPVWETFNYTQSRDADYYLNFGNLNTGIAASYQAVNTKNAVWADQTEVFGSSQQNWKGAKELWSNTFGYVPVVGNTGNIVFGIHDSLNGMTADDRVGGNAAAVISGLQLAHELAPSAIETGLGDLPAAVKLATPQQYGWKFSEQTSDFNLVRAPKASNESDIGTTLNDTPPTVNRLQPSQARNISEYAVPNGEQLIEHATPNTQGIYQIKDATNAGDHWFIRYTDDTGSNRVYEIRSDFKLSDQYVQIIDPKTRKPVLTAHATGDGQWQAASNDGGKWPWVRTPSPTPSNDLKTGAKFSDAFEILGDPKTSGADKFDAVFNYNNATAYEQSVSNFEEAGVLKRKLTVSSTVEENNFEVYPSETAQPNEHSATSYSPNFIKDLNRDHYTVRIKQPDGYTTVELDGTGTAEGETLRKRLSQFEDAVPDANLRSRISEVAHQGSVAPTSVELKINQLQDHVGFKGTGTHYVITYDPLIQGAQVEYEAVMILLDLDKDAEVIPDIEVRARRTFHIVESNHIDGQSNPYIIEKNAPFNLSTTTITNLA
ncbi:hypothetical protein [Pseudomonas kitaguniensis]|uniref:hypothetical protein n=1 Tax=Pseudomonas kitaguniensis TaxID=2607908 RepID=UPI001F503341|nr:hypothetical protein [Pseudomonas kitaguniensis]